MNNSLPKEYIPFNKVWVCSNIFHDGKIIFSIDENPIFLIGRDKESSKTLLWFSSQKKETTSKKFHNVISKNKIIDERFDLLSTEYGDEIKFNGHSLIQFRVVDDRLVINMIDLKPIGLNIFGGLSSLTIVSNNFSNCTFADSNTMIAIGG